MNRMINQNEKVAFGVARETGFAALREFVQQGGRLVLLDHSAAFAPRDD
jgi:hypothetical protein